MKKWKVDLVIFLKDVKILSIVRCRSGEFLGFPALTRNRSCRPGMCKIATLELTFCEKFARPTAHDRQYFEGGVFFRDSDPEIVERHRIKTWYSMMWTGDTQRFYYVAKEIGTRVFDGNFLDGVVRLLVTQITHRLMRELYTVRSFQHTPPWHASKNTLFHARIVHNTILRTHPPWHVLERQNI